MRRRGPCNPGILVALKIFPTKKHPQSKELRVKMRRFLWMEVILCAKSRFEVLVVVAPRMDSAKLGRVLRVGRMST